MYMTQQTTHHAMQHDTAQQHHSSHTESPDVPRLPFTFCCPASVWLAGNSWARPAALVQMFVINIHKAAWWQSLPGFSLFALADAPVPQNPPPPGDICCQTSPELCTWVSVWVDWNRHHSCARWPGWTDDQKYRQSWVRRLSFLLQHLTVWGEEMMSAETSCRSGWEEQVHGTSSMSLPVTTQRALCSDTRMCKRLQIQIWSRCQRLWLWTF